MAAQTIWLHADAPRKPALGQACNGCGVCCAAEPCPLGVLISGRLRGRCRALRFDTQAQHYRCGLLPAPPIGGPRATRWWRTATQRLVSRWIAAGAGCDSDAQAAPAARPHSAHLTEG